MLQSIQRIESAWKLRSDLFNEERFAGDRQLAE